MTLSLCFTSLCTSFLSLIICMFLLALFWAISDDCGRCCESQINKLPISFIFVIEPPFFLSCSHILLLSQTLLFSFCSVALAVGILGQLALNLCLLILIGSRYVIELMLHVQVNCSETHLNLFGCLTSHVQYLLAVLVSFDVRSGGISSLHGKVLRPNCDEEPLAEFLVLSWAPWNCHLLGKAQNHGTMLSGS